MNTQITNRDRNFIDIAVKNAISNDRVGGARSCALITIRGRVIGFGRNQRKTHPLQVRFAKNKDAIFLHAEIDAIRNALRFIDVDGLRKVTLYIGRAKKEHNGDNSKFIWGLAKPCKNGCMRAIETFGISRICYTTNEQTIEVLTR